MSAVTPPPAINLTLPFATEFAEVRKDAFTKSHSVFAKRAFAFDRLICEFNWSEVLTTPNYLTIQIGEDQHIRMLPSFLECINHSCDPNVFFDTTNRGLICVKPIKEGDELTFFYPSAEWDMDRPFNCHCGSKQCIGYIEGAKYLTPMQRSRYRFTEFIQQKLA